MTILKLDNVKYIYDAGTSFENTAISGVDLEIDEGSFVCLIGHTGSGKSTLLQMLNGLLVPSEGKILINGADISSKSYDRRSICKDVGLVFQYPEYQLFEETVIKDICFGPKNLGLDDEEQMRRGRKALASVGLGEDIMQKSPFELSGGQKRRAAIAGILAMQPKILALDEPAAGLDPAGREEIKALIKKINKESRTTVLWSSHSMEDAADLADRIIVMDSGRIVRDGEPGIVFSDIDYLESIGLAPPQIVYLMDKLRKNGLDMPEGICRIEDAADEIVRLWRKKYAS